MYIKKLVVYSLITFGLGLQIFSQTELEKKLYQENFITYLNEENEDEINELSYDKERYDTDTKVFNRKSIEAFLTLSNYKFDNSIDKFWVDLVELSIQNEEEGKVEHYLKSIDLDKIGDKKINFVKNCASIILLKHLHKKKDNTLDIYKRFDSEGKKIKEILNKASNDLEPKDFLSLEKSITCDKFKASSILGTFPVKKCGEELQEVIDGNKKASLLNKSPCYISISSPIKENKEDLISYLSSPSKNKDKIDELLNQHGIKMKYGEDYETFIYIGIAIASICVILYFLVSFLMRGPEITDDSSSGFEKSGKQNTDEIQELIIEMQQIKSELKELRDKNNENTSKIEHLLESIIIILNKEDAYSKTSSNTQQNASSFYSLKPKNGVFVASELKQKDDNYVRFIINMKNNKEATYSIVEDDGRRKRIAETFSQSLEDDFCIVKTDSFPPNSIHIDKEGTLTKTPNGDWAIKDKLKITLAQK